MGIGVDCVVAPRAVQGAKCQDTDVGELNNKLDRRLKVSKSVTEIMIMKTNPNACLKM